MMFYVTCNFKFLLDPCSWQLSSGSLRGEVKGEGDVKTDPDEEDEAGLLGFGGIEQKKDWT